MHQVKNGDVAPSGARALGPIVRKNTIVLRVVTPADARRALERMTPRRKPMDKRRVSHLAELMRRGEFLPKGPDGGDGYRVVAFNDRGELASGRHRMQAVIESGRHVAMDVANFGDWPTCTV